MSAPPPFLHVEGLRRDFDLSRTALARALSGEPRRIVRAVDGVDFAIPRGETFGLVGESGSGKSTLAKMIVGLLPPSGGRTLIDGQDLAAPPSAAARRALRRRIQLVFQDPYASLNPRWRVGDIIAEPIGVFGLRAGRAAVAARVRELLELVGLTGADARKYPHEFSGGQRQRIAIARALASEAEFLVCDEPTSALDVSIQAQILNLLRDLQERLGLTYLLITHNLAVVRFLSNRIGVMYLGRLVEIADGEDLFRAPRHPYSRMLLDATPDLEMSGRARLHIGGEPPNPMAPPAGCGFHPRCPRAQPRCRAEAPAMREGVACHDPLADGEAMIAGR